MNITVIIIYTNSMQQNLLENLTVTQLVKKLPTFYGTMFTAAGHWFTALRPNSPMLTPPPNNIQFNFIYPSMVSSIQVF